MREGERDGEERKKGMGAKRKRGRRTAEEEKQNSEGCSVRERERVDKIT